MEWAERSTGRASSGVLALSGDICLPSGSVMVWGWMAEISGYCSAACALDPLSY